MSKRILSIVLAAVLLLGIASVPAMAESDPYAEHLSFTVFTIDGADDMFDWPLVKQAMEKFNFDFKIQLVAWDSWDQVTRTLAYTDTLPEVLAWYNMNYSEYREWVEEGVFKALPDDLSAYPNLEKLRDTYTVFQQIQDEDGHIYCFPKIKNSNPVNLYSTYMFAYRRDWAKAIGYDFDPVQKLTYAEFVDYLRAVKEKDPGQMGNKLVPLDFDNGGNHWALFAQQWNLYVASFKVEDGKYVWGAPDETSLQGIRAIKQLYDEGLLAMDSYNDSNNAGRERFLAGRSAVLYGNLGASILQTTAKTLQSNVEGFQEEDLGLMCVTMEDGTYHVSQIDEWWGAFAFAANCRDEVMERWLAVGNWLLEPEQVETYAYGVKGSDWDYDENGNVVLNYTDADIAATGDKYYIAQERSFQKYFILEGLEVFLKGNPAYSSYIIDDLFRTNMETWATNASFKPNDYNLGMSKSEDYHAFTSINGDIKNIIIKAVISDDCDKIWNDFIAENKAAADKAAAALTEEFLK